MKKFFYKRWSFRERKCGNIVQGLPLLCHSHLKKLLLTLGLLFLPLQIFAATSSVTQTAAGDYTWLCPPGVTTLQVELRGGGGSGGGSTTNPGGGGGAAGGQYSINSSLAVTAGTTYNYTVAAAQTTVGTGNGSDGHDSTFNTNSVVAKGGQHGTSYQGGATHGTGSTTGGVGTVTAGVSGEDGTTTYGGAGGAGGNSGGAGGARKSSDGNGNNGTAPGGGGSGGFKNTTSSRNGGTGAAGKSILTYTTPLVSALTDNFNDNSLDAKWTTYIDTGAGSIAEANQEIEITTNINVSGYTELYSVNDYDLTGSSMTIKVIDRGSITNTNLYFYPLFAIIWSGNYDLIGWDIFTLDGINMRICPVKRINYSFTLIGTDVAYNANTYRYLKIRELSGTTYFDYSADGLNWNNFNSVANPITITAIRGSSSVYTTSATVSATTAKVDDFNILPSGTNHNGDFFQFFN